MIYKLNSRAEAHIRNTGPGKVVQVVIRGDDGYVSEPHYFPNQEWALRELRALERPRYGGLVVSTILMVLGLAILLWGIHAALVGLPVWLVVTILLMGR